MRRDLPRPAAAASQVTANLDIADYEILSNSPLFDRRWYLEAYADVALAGVDPVAHYLTYGASEGRNPSPDFDTRSYICDNPDVEMAGLNPLVHFLRYGIHEGRFRAVQGSDAEPLIEVMSGHVPQSIFIDLSTACNAKCVMCPTQLAPERNGIMTDALFAKIVRESSTFSPHVTIGVHGEPLVDKKLDQKIALCSDLGLRTQINTNGSLLDVRRSVALLDARPSTIMISLESMKPDVYERIRVGLRHEIVVENIKRLIALRDESGSSTQVAIRFIVSDWNRGEQKEYMDYWSAFLNTDGPTRDYIEADPLHNWAYGDEGKFHGNSPCPHVELMTILSDGTVAGCCLDHSAIHNFGNVSTQTLLEIFNGAAMSKFRAVHLDFKRDTLDLCRTCNIAELWANQLRSPGRAKQTELESTFIAAEHAPSAHR